MSRHKIPLVIQYPVPGILRTGSLIQISDKNSLKREMMELYESEKDGSSCSEEFFFMSAWIAVSTQNKSRIMNYKASLISEQEKRRLA